MNLYTVHQLGESLPDLQGEGHTVYAGVQAIRERIDGGEIRPLGQDHYAISTHGGTGLCQLVLNAMASV